MASQRWAARLLLPKPSCRSWSWAARRHAAAVTMRQAADGGGLYDASFTGPSPAQSSATMLAHAALLAKSFKQVVGSALVPGVDELLGADVCCEEKVAELLWTSPMVVVSHGRQADPVLNYGSQAALQLWELPWDKLTVLPSRYTAEPMEREERAELLQAVHTQGYMDRYSGIRVSATGRRFRIKTAIIWNVIHDHQLLGQAATFDPRLIERLD
eukprot:TRINITY_DN80922_c0_g1_i1.p1 TRINITY_DN80922_c0_g1~~TRINITY_DN80922_c0_g1_i1.p1  ORF type:complete len:232 (-),score=23.87 TRINITY_DN80922_c0_g1_i1:401-1042(-)